MAKGKPTAWRKTPADHWHIKTGCAQSGLTATAFLRIAIRHLNYSLGYAMPESVELLLVVQQLTAACRLNGLGGMDRLLNSADAIVRRNQERVVNASPYPLDIHRELVEEERRIGKLKGDAPARKRKSHAD